MKTRRKRRTGRVKVSPSILSANFARLGEQVKEAEEAGADSIHVDVMDGRFVPNITIGPVVVEYVRASTRLPLDVHLMIVEPEKYIESFVRAGASLVYVHQETCPHLHRTIWQIRDLGARPAVTLNPSTPVTTVSEVLMDIDRILVMTVNPGFGGQRFISTMLPKIEKTREIIDSGSYAVEIEVDGGITARTAIQAVRAGATNLVAGSSIFKAKSIKQAIAGLRRAVSGE